MAQRPATQELGEQEIHDLYNIPEVARPYRPHTRWARPEISVDESKVMGFKISGEHDMAIEQWARRNKTTRSAALAMIIDKAIKGSRL